MKYLIFGDTHCTRASEFAAPTADGLNEYLQQWSKSMDFMCSCVEEHKPGVLVFLGDLWDAQDYVDTMSLDLAVKKFAELTECAKRHATIRLAVCGNHDSWSVVHNIHKLRFLRSLGWTVAEGLEELSCGTDSVMLVPYRDPASPEWSTWEDFIKRPADIVFSHVDVVGGRYRKPRGDVDSKAYCTHGLLPAMTRNDSLVFNGHFHHPSQVASNFYNVGALTSRTFHDKGSDPRGALLYDSVSKNVLRLVNPAAPIFAEFWVQTEEDIKHLLEHEDTPSTYAKLHYDPSLQDHVLAVQSIFAGARLLPVEKEVQYDEAKTTGTLVSLRDHCAEYIARVYSLDERLSDFSREGLTILGEAEKSQDSYQSRLPLEFGEVELSNFQSIAYIKVDLRRQGLVFIRGINDDDAEQESNGAGKSSLEEGLFWVLTGKSLRGHKVNDVIRWGSDFVRGSLVIHAGKSIYKIIRSRKDPELGTGLKLEFLSGEDISSRLKGSTEEQLAAIIGRSDTNLKHVCFILADMAHRYTALTHDQRARLLEDIIDSRVYEIAQDISKSREDTARAAVIVARTSVDRTSHSLESVRNEATNAKLQVDFVHSNTEDQASSMTKELAEVISNIAGLEHQVSQDQAIRKDIDDSAEVLRDKEEELLAAISAVMKTRSKLDSDISGIASLVAKAEKLKANDLCPTCSAPVDKTAIHVELSAHYADTSVLRDQRAEKTSMIEAYETRRTQMSSARKDKATLLSKLSISISDNERKIKGLLNTKSVIESKLQSLQSSREAAESRLAAALDRVVSLEKALAADTAQLSAATKVHGIFSDLRNSIFDERGIRKDLLAKVAVPFLNNKMRAYTEYLTGGKSVILDPDTLDVVLSGNYSYVGNSSGEKRRVDLLIQFALNDLAVATGRSSIGYLVVDEVLDKLDEPGIYAVKRVLEQKAVDSTIHMVSHVKYAAAIMTKQLVLYKKDGATRILEGDNGVSSVD